MTSFPVSPFPLPPSHTDTHTKTHTYTHTPAGWILWDHQWANENILGGLWTGALSQSLHWHPGRTAWWGALVLWLLPEAVSSCSCADQSTRAALNQPGSGISTCPPTPRGHVLLGTFFPLRGPWCCLLASPLHSCQHVLALLRFSCPQSSYKGEWMRQAPSFLAASQTFPSCPTSTPYAGSIFASLLFSCELPPGKDKATKIKSHARS